MSAEVHRILVIDDAPEIHELFRSILISGPEAADESGADVMPPSAQQAAPEPARFEVDSAYQGMVGVAMVAQARQEQNPYALAFVDLRMPPGCDGVEATQRIWQEDPAVQIVICTGYADLSARAIATNLGKTDRLLILKKPFDAVEASQLASALTEKWRLARQVEAHIQNLQALVKEKTQDLDRAVSLIRATLDATAEGMLVVNRGGQAVNFNEAFLRLWRLPRAVLEDGVEGWLTPVLGQLKNPGEFQNRIGETLARQESETAGVLELADGRFFEHHSHPQRLAGEVVGRVWVFRDISEHKRAEDKVRLLAHTMESIREMATITDLEDRIIFVNKACLDKYGYRREEVIGRHFNLFHSPNRPPAVAVEVARSSRLGGWRGEIMNRTRDGRDFLISLSTSPIVDGECNIIGLAGIAEDITEQKRAEQALRDSENQYRLLFESNPISIYVYDQANLRFLEANEAAVRHYGYSKQEFLGMTLREIALPEEIPAFLEGLSRLSASAGSSRIWRHRRKDGKLIEMEITSHSLAFPGRRAWLSLAIEVTERSSLEAQLRQSQKMESVGQLAGGIAHDFNNLLTVISGHSGILLAKEALSPQIAEPLKEIAEAAKRAAELTRQLLTFSRKQVLQLQVADLNEVVNNVTKMLRRILGEDISLHVSFAPSLPCVKADLGMIEQVLVNLAVNSRDAMPKGGQLSIDTAAVAIDDAYAQQNPDASPGRFVCMTFSDTGCGIPPENLARIFEPFFTTKELDRGTGLGLATVYGIVKQHQGWIKVTSQVGLGATFQIFLPSCAEQSGEFTLSTTEQRVIGGTETILVVEDEAPLLKLIHHILESHGYKVLESSSGHAALNLWEEHREKIDLLLTDLILPDGMAGPELAAILQAAKPGLKVIYTSGYDMQRLAKEFTLGDGVNFIQKPFHARKLAETVYDCLHGTWPPS